MNGYTRSVTVKQQLDVQIANSVDINRTAKFPFPSPPSYDNNLFHGRSRTAYLYRCVWSGITGR